MHVPFINLEKKNIFLFIHLSLGLLSMIHIVPKVLFSMISRSQKVKLI